MSKLIKTFDDGAFVLATSHAEATFEAFRESRQKLTERFGEVLARPDSKPTAKLDGATRFFEIIEGADGLKFEAGYDIEDQGDGGRTVQVKTLRVLGR
jgi:hypothetical protein